jgi:hypothetical protein
MARRAPAPGHTGLSPPGSRTPPQRAVAGLGGGGGRGGRVEGGGVGGECDGWTTVGNPWGGVLGLCKRRVGGGGSTSGPCLTTSRDTRFRSGVAWRPLPPTSVHYMPPETFTQLLPGLHPTTAMTLLTSLAERHGCGQKRNDNFQSTTTTTSNAIYIFSGPPPPRLGFGAPLPANDLLGTKKKGLPRGRMHQTGLEGRSRFPLLTVPRIDLRGLRHRRRGESLRLVGQHSPSRTHRLTSGRRYTDLRRNGKM